MIEIIVSVGIADMKIVKAPNKIKTAGLGSCVGVVIYDPLSHIAGIAHIMLPDSSLARGKPFNPAKFADTAISKLKKDLLYAGALPLQLKAKIAGGAQMFQFSKGNDHLRIGPRNVEAVKKHLSEHRITLVAEDTGGNSGRTIEFDPQTSVLRIKTVYQKMIEI